MAAPLHAIAESCGGLPQPPLDGSIGQPLPLDCSRFAGSEVTQGVDILGQVLLAASWKDALGFLEWKFPDTDSHLFASPPLPTILLGSSHSTRAYLAGNLC